MQPRPLQVTRLTASDAPRIVETFCDAFYDYPVMRYIVGAPDELYDQRLATLVRFFAMARVLRNEPLLGVRVAGDLLATATMSQPANTEPPPGFAELMEETWQSLGPEAFARYERCSAVWGPLAPDFPQRNTPGSQGVSLTTELPRNVELYRHVGYELTGYVYIAPGIETWALFRQG